MQKWAWKIGRRQNSTRYFCFIEHLDDFEMSDVFRSEILGHLDQEHQISSLQSKKTSPFSASFVSSRMSTNSEDFVGKNNLRCKYCAFSTSKIKVCQVDVPLHRNKKVEQTTIISILTTKNIEECPSIKNHSKVLILRCDVLNIFKTNERRDISKP